MILGSILAAALVVLVLAVLGYLPWLIALPAVLIVAAFVFGYRMRRGGPLEPPSREHA